MLSYLRALLLAAPLLIALGGHSAASSFQDEDEAKKPPVPCNFCDSKGTKECRRHGRSERELEESEVCQFCSYVISCKECGGTLEVDCERCENPEAEARIANQRKRNEEWYAKRKAKVDELVKHEVLHLSSAHFDLSHDLKPMKVGKKRLDTHEHAHLYLERLEEFRDLFIETLQLAPHELGIRSEIYMWRDGRDQSLAARKFADIGSSGAGVKLMGAYSVYTMQYQKRYMNDDEDLHRNIVHNVSHLLLSNIKPELWVGQLKGGWVDAGLAHYFEFKLDEKCTNFCYQEQATERGFKNGKWLVPVRKMVAMDDLVPFAETITKNTDQLTEEEHALSFSYVHFCLEGDLVEKDHGKAFMQVVRVLKTKGPTRDGLQKAYGQTVFGFVEKWKEWVLRTYPTR